jgi:hypothetical protein
MASKRITRLGGGLFSQVFLFDPFPDAGFLCDGSEAFRIK